MVADEGDSAGVGQPTPWWMPAVPEVEERLFKAEALVKFGVPHKQNAWLLPQPAERKQQLVLLLHQSAGRVHTGAAESAGGTSASALAPSLDLLPAARQLSTAVPTAFVAPAVPLAALMASGGRAELTLMLRRSAAPHLPAGTDALQKIQTCLVLVEAALTAGTLSLKMHKSVWACLDNQSSMRQESMLRSLHIDVEHHLRIAKERKKNAHGAVSAAKNNPRKIPHHNIYMYIHVYIKISIYTYIYIQMYMYIYIRYVYIHTYIHVYLTLTYSAFVDILYFVRRQRCGGDRLAMGRW